MPYKDSTKNLRLRQAAEFYWADQEKLGSLPPTHLEVDLGDGSESVELGKYFYLQKQNGPKGRIIPEILEMIRKDEVLARFLETNKEGREYLRRDAPTVGAHRRDRRPGAVTGPNVGHDVSRNAQGSGTEPAVPLDSPTPSPPPSPRTRERVAAQLPGAYSPDAERWENRPIAEAASRFRPAGQPSASTRPQTPELYKADDQVQGMLMPAGPTRAPSWPKEGSSATPKRVRRNR